MLVDINVGGTQKILETARKARNLDRVFYMGTAYISGNNQGVIPQDEMPPNNGFKSHLENLCGREKRGEVINIKDHLESRSQVV